jgi:two-component system, sensor histidine kinase and response regulator
MNPPIRLTRAPCMAWPLRLLALAAVACTFPWAVAAAPQRLTVAILGIDQPENQVRRAESLDRYLSQQLADVDVRVVTLDFAGMERAILARQVDLVVTSTPDYLVYSDRNGLSAPLASIVQQFDGKRLPGTGGTILVRSDRRDINTLQDLRGKRIAIIGERSLGGFQVQAYELLQQGIKVSRDVVLVKTGLPQEQVMEYVLDGRADAAFVRSGMLEAWVQGGRIDGSALKLLGRRDLPGYPFALSTALYPNSPVAAMPQLDTLLAKRVVAALLTMPDGALGADPEIAQFALPADYESIRRLARELKLPPYDHEPPVTFADLWEDQRPWVVALLASIALVLGLLGFAARSVERLRRIAGQLEASEARFRRLFQETRQPALLMRGVHFVDANKAAAGMLSEASSGNLFGRTPMDFSPECQPDGVLSSEKAAAMIRIATEQGSHQFAWRHLRPGGELLDVHVLLTLIDFGDEQLVHAAMIDVTEATRNAAELAEHRRHLEELVVRRTEALEAANELVRASESRLALALDAANDAVWDWDIRAGTAYCSPPYLRMLGHDSAEARGTVEAVLLDRLPPEERVTLTGTMRDALLAGQADLEMPLRARDGSYRWVHVRARVVERDERGRPLRAAGTISDVTARKEMELALLESKERAETASVAKSAFLANMSHEIRTPMNAILGFTQLLEFDLDDTAAREKLARIQVAARHLLGIIDDILDFSKIEADRMSLVEANVDVSALLQEVHGTLAERASAKGLYLRMETDPALADHSLVGDPMRIRQVLFNFIGNAIKFTQQGGVTLRATLEAADASGVQLQFSVADTGIGLSDDEQSRLFLPFEQVQSGSTRRYGGTGLGLAISRRLARLMDGDCGVTSAAGGGSTFWFKVRLRVGRVEIAEPIRPRAGGPRRGSSVLIVEDNEVNQAMARAMLNRFGLRVDVANDGAEAVEKVRTGRYDAVLMDLQMPVMDGLEAARTIRGLEQGRTVPIIAMTASAFAADRASCIESGMNGYVAKPVQIESLRSALAEWLPDFNPR